MILRLSDCLGRLSANTRLLIWLALLAAMTLLAVQALSRGATVQSDILAMLPKIQEDPLTQRAIDRVEQQLANRIYLGVVSPDQASAVAGAKALLASLQDAPEAFTQVQSADMQGAQALNRFYFPYRFHLLTAQQRALLESGQLAKLEANTLAQLYNAFGYANSQLLSQDPLLLYPELLKQLSPQRRLKVVDGILVGQEATPGSDGQKRSVAIVMAQGVGSAFNPKAQELQLARLEEAITQMQQDLGTEQNMDVLRGGALFHAAAATKQAKQEVSSLGLASLIGVILLVWLAFRSIMPLTIAALTIATSLLFALGATLWIFTQVHLLTLVFGTSLIGIAIDYSFHFYCERLQAQKNDVNKDRQAETNTATNTATSAVARVFPAASLALLTTVIAYLAIGLTPFPGMQQVAVFCAAGLLGAYLTLIFAYPKLANSAMTPGERALGLAARYLNAMQIIARPMRGIKGVVIALGLLLVTVIGLNRLEVNDDIRALQQSPLSVTQGEERLRQVMSGGTDNQFILVRAETPEALLTRLETLTPTLNSLQSQDVLGNSVNLANYLPSQASQQEAYRLQRQIYHKLPEVLARLGLDSDLAPSLMASFEASANETITPTNFFADKAGELFAPLWLVPELSSKLSPELSHGLSHELSHELSLETDTQAQKKTSDSDTYGAIVLLGGIKNLGTLTQAITPLDGVSLVDKVQDISDVMAKYRSLTLILLALALLVAGLIFSLRFGLKMALWITAVPALAALLTLAGLGLAGSPLTLFHALALILVFGIGVDYSLFFAESHRGEGVMMAVFMSACSTLMAFGLLAFSQTPAIHYFGLTLLLGIGLTFLLSPFIHTLTRIDK
ncbi:MMPL family transporter [Shewanella sp. Isolate7]|uniref:MMPL family transporter n=1 Tax=Shewanella sp. Isolate7 TaxID=2908528 RepID=UPI001EFE9580|nr:MMPL family transporter [Shewanella sp. Isolate7]MCG9720142.1 MMPL family transporter [Shewanella sp. Isolate7]